MSEIPFYPDEDPVTSAVTKEVKESYGRGHDDGYRMALHDVEVHLNKIGQGRLGFQIRCQLADEMRKIK
jgi:hypothetical protein